MVHEGHQPRGIVGRMTWMPNLHAIDALIDEGLDPFSRSGVRRMGEDRQAAGPMDERDGIDDRQAILGHIRRTPVAEVAVERVAEVDGPAFGDHRAGNVRTTDGAARGLLQHRRQLDADAKLVQSLDDPCCPSAPHVPQSDELAFHRAHVAQMQAEDVRFTVALDGTQLDARNDPHAKLGTHRRRFGYSVDRVVVRQRERREANAFRLTDDVSRSTRSVRRRRVRVKVDESLAGLTIRPKIAHAE